MTVKHGSLTRRSLINHLGMERFRPFSAGSHPTGKVNLNALATLQCNGLPTEGCQSQSRDDFAGQHIDSAIATAVMLFGLSSGAALATVAGVLIEVPVMRVLVGFCKRTDGWFIGAVDAKT